METTHHMYIHVHVHVDTCSTTCTCTYTVYYMYLYTPPICHPVLDRRAGANPIPHTVLADGGELLWLHRECSPTVSQ